jgi:lipopolysaccharide export system protein LptA
MKTRSSAMCLVAAMALSASLTVTPALSQQTKGKVDIEADSMELFEAKSQAIFKGNVRARRQGMRLSANTLLVKFTKNGSGSTQVTWLETSGGVEIVTSTQVITGDWMRMNVKANTAVVGGGVTVKQGTSLVHGDRLNVDLNTNQSKFSGGRVKGSFVPD